VLSCAHAAKRISYVPLSVPIEESTRPSAACEAADPIIAFSGSMYLPGNVEAITWFVEEVFPLVRCQVLEAQLLIIGRDPARAVRKLARQANVSVTGFVPSAQRLLRRASVVIVPVWHGAGVKVKLLEGIGLGQLVVTTSHGILGTRLEPGVHVLVADHPRDFADACVAGLRHPDRFAEIRTRARAYFLSHHAETTVGNKFQQELLSITAAT